MPPSTLQKLSRVTPLLLVASLLLVLSYHDLGIDARRGIYGLSIIVFAAILTLVGYLQWRIDEYRRVYARQELRQQGFWQCIRPMLGFWMLSLINFGLLTLGVSGLKYGDPKQGIFLIFLCLVIEILLSLRFLDHRFDQATPCQKNNGCSKNGESGPPTPDK